VSGQFSYKFEAFLVTCEAPTDTVAIEVSASLSTCRYVTLCSAQTHTLSLLATMQQSVLALSLRCDTVRCVYDAYAGVICCSTIMSRSKLCDFCYLAVQCCYVALLKLLLFASTDNYCCVCYFYRYFYRWLLLQVVPADAVDSEPLGTAIVPLTAAAVCHEPITLPLVRSILSLTISVP
jgi:hypothetical protein